MRTPTSRRSSEHLPISVPLISLSRSPSPYARRPASTSNVASEEEDDDDDDYDDHVAAAGMPLVASDIGRGSRRIGDHHDQHRSTTIRLATVGRWLLSSTPGQQILVMLLVILSFVCGTALVHLNSLILLSK